MAAIAMEQLWLQEKREEEDSGSKEIGESRVLWSIT
jgi:hypothetical protein